MSWGQGHDCVYHGRHSSAQQAGLPALLLIQSEPGEGGGDPTGPGRSPIRMLGEAEVHLEGTTLQHR